MKDVLCTTLLLEERVNIEIVIAVFLIVIILNVFVRFILFK